jgi:ribosome-associated toxin RatA of RatAB toxin-antitoxin module
MASVKREKEMPVPVSALYRAITDFESYPQFINEVVGVRVAPGGSDQKKKVTFELDLMKRFEYTLEFNLTENREAAWHLVDSNFFKVNSGRWLLNPMDESATSVVYELEVAFGFLVPGWVSRKLTEINLPKMFDSFEERARNLNGKG